MGSPTCTTTSQQSNNEFQQLVQLVQQLQTEIKDLKSQVKKQLENVYDQIDELGFGLMFHGFDYPDETGVAELHSRFWHATLKYGVLEFPRPEQCTIRRFVRAMDSKDFLLGKNILTVEEEDMQL